MVQLLEAGGVAVGPSVAMPSRFFWSLIAAVEFAREELASSWRHPHWVGLKNCSSATGVHFRLLTLSNSPVSPQSRRSSCNFASRCPYRLKFPFPRSDTLCRRRDTDRPLSSAAWICSPFTTNAEQKLPHLRHLLRGTSAASMSAIVLTRY